MPRSASDIRKAFDALSEELANDHEHAEMVVAGGAALVLLFGARDSTKDVDALFVKPRAALIRRAAVRVADRLGLPNDWLNDGAKGYFVGVSGGEMLYASPSLSVRAASVEQLLAMKLGAWRDAVDRADAKILLSHLHGSKDDVWSRVEKFVSLPEQDKASYAFEDLWDAEHAT